MVDKVGKDNFNEQNTNCLLNNDANESILGITSSKIEGHVYSAMCTKCAGEFEHKKRPDEPYKDPDKVSGVEQIKRGLIIESKSFLDANKSIYSLLSFDLANSSSNNLKSNETELDQAKLKQNPIESSIQNNSSPRRLFDRRCIIQEHALSNRNINDYYSFNIGTLGRGSYGSVVKALDKQLNIERAVKIIFKPKLENINRLKREILIMKRLDHPNIIKLFEVFEDKENLYFVMEICNGGELFDIIIKRGHFSEKYAAYIMKQIFSAISYCHLNDFMHRDLKPENLLFADSSSNSLLKVIDWGFAAKCPKSHNFTSIVGTPYYVAPEILSGNYNKSCDLWSAGVILYILLSANPPFQGKDNVEILKKVKVGKFSFHNNIWKFISLQAKDLITKLLTLNPSKRITAQSALTHPWIKTLTESNNIDSLDVKMSNRYIYNDLFSRFKDFQKQSKLKKLALTCVAYHLKYDDIKLLQTLFNKLDVNSDGILTTNEIRNVLIELGGKEESFDEDISNLLLELDTDGNGRIDYTEFLAASIDHKYYKEESLCKAAFKVFDLNLDGKISVNELHKVLNITFVQEAFEFSTIKALINEIDTNNDGCIDFDEFMAMMSNNHTKPDIQKHKPSRIKTTLINFSELFKNKKNHI